MIKKYKSTTGFTLIELMITVAILAIIAAIAYPSYQQYVLETRRANAQSDLLELASFMERYYGERFTYVGAVLPFNTSPKQGNVAYYNLAVVAGSASTTAFRLSATPINAQANDRCGTLTIDQTGNHGAAQNDCW